MIEVITRGEALVDARDRVVDEAVAAGLPSAIVARFTNSRAGQRASSSVAAAKNTPMAGVHSGCGKRHQQKAAPSMHSVAPAASGRSATPALNATQATTPAAKTGNWPNRLKRTKFRTR